MRNGGQLVGYGMARAALFAYQPPCKAIASIRRDGTAFVRSGATDIGPGTYTVMTMLAADCLGVPIERVRFGLGDSAMPKAPQEGGSGLTGALGNAVQAACVDLVRAFVNRVSDDELSPLKGCRLERHHRSRWRHPDHGRSGALRNVRRHPHAARSGRADD